MRALIRLCGDDREALDLIDQAVQAEQRQGQRTDLVNVVNEVDRPFGNTKERALHKLRQDMPELHARVLAGELSAGSMLAVTERESAQARHASGAAGGTW